MNPLSDVFLKIGLSCYFNTDLFSFLRFRFNCPIWVYVLSICISYAIIIIQFKHGLNVELSEVNK